MHSPNRSDVFLIIWAFSESPHSQKLIHGVWETSEDVIQLESSLCFVGWIICLAGCGSFPLKNLLKNLIVSLISLLCWSPPWHQHTQEHTHLQHTHINTHTTATWAHLASAVYHNWVIFCKYDLRGKEMLSEIFPYFKVVKQFIYPLFAAQLQDIQNQTWLQCVSGLDLVWFLCQIQLQVDL